MILNKEQLNAIADGLWKLIEEKREKQLSQDHPVSGDSPEIEELMTLHNDVEALVVTEEPHTFYMMS